MKKGTKKTTILFVDRLNDLSSQLAEYHTNKVYPDLYEVYSAGPEKDIVDCDLLSVMYSRGEDMRNQRSKDFFDELYLPKGEPYDYVIYLDKAVFDEFHSRSPWQGKQILVHMGGREEFKCTDDAELAEELIALSEKIRKWVEENLDNPEKLQAMVSA